VLIIRRSNCINTASGIVLSVSDRPVCRCNLHTGRSLTENAVQDIVHQVGHLPIAASVEPTDCQSFSPSWCRAPSEIYGQKLDHFKYLVSYSLPAPSLRRELVYPFSEVKVLVTCSCLHILHCVFMNLYYLNPSRKFDVLLTVYLSIFISVFNQLDAQKFVLQ